ncbi:MAG: class I tRNA ligase family protein, partial [Thaumarchaeota archaeon]|nr:class I tRNA ligase family protein [Nitrososphaerota archaeon]
NKLATLLEECSRLKPGKLGDLQAEDRWIQSKLFKLVPEVSAAIEKMRLREALHGILYTFDSDLNWYIKRANAKGRTDISTMLYRLICTRVLMLSPFAPHIAEEMWEKLGQSGLVSASAWPDVSGDVIDVNAIQSEELLKGIMEDITNILKVTKIIPKKIIIYTADAFKGLVYHSILQKVMAGQTNMGEIMKDLISNQVTSDIKKNPDFVQRTIKDILSEPTEIRETKLKTKEFDEKSLISNELTSLAKADFGVEVQVFSESDDGIYDPKGKARHARPFKPAILIE